MVYGQWINRLLGNEYVMSFILGKNYGSINDVAVK